MVAWFLDLVHMHKCVNYVGAMTNQIAREVKKGKRKMAAISSM